MGRPAFIPVPSMILRFMLSEERAKIMTEGQKVIPERTQRFQFEYHFPDINSACKELVDQ